MAGSEGLWLLWAAETAFFGGLSLLLRELGAFSLPRLPIWQARRGFWLLLAAETAFWAGSEGLWLLWAAETAFSAG
ncbi:hypothetical protein BC351_37595 [Paenibacillus ferrarius]|uniref:Uncharacterized protein n=1 Tax=Paenibacillus ferrarius TaxID=1469647 RepID=A0A1V4HB90_9BACL|nr:hypothetical protein BC351_37595 [Paenibacillus ferrarius]